MWTGFEPRIKRRISNFCYLSHTSPLGQHGSKLKSCREKNIKVSNRNLKGHIGKIIFLHLCEQNDKEAWMLYTCSLSSSFLQPCCSPVKKWSRDHFETSCLRSVHLAFKPNHIPGSTVWFRNKMAHSHMFCFKVQLHRKRTDLQLHQKHALLLLRVGHGQNQFRPPQMHSSMLCIFTLR